MLESGTLYLIIAAALIFGAGIFAAKRVFPHLTGKQVMLMVLVTALALAAVWSFLAWTGRKHDRAELAPDVSQPPPLLQPSPD